MVIQGNTQANQPSENQGTPVIPAATQSETVKDNETTATQAVIPVELQKKISDKYGGDMNKALEGLMQAETKMHEATTKVKELERELEQIKFQQQGYPPPHSSVGPVSEDERMKIETEYGMPYDQAMGFYKIAQIAITPAIDISSRAELANIKDRLRKSDPNFTPEVEEKFDRLINQKHPQDRLIPQIYNEVLKMAKGDSIDAIIESRLNSKIKELQGEPNPPPPINRSGGIAPKILKTSVTDTEAARIASWKYGKTDTETINKVKEDYAE